MNGNNYEELKLDKQICFPLYACAKEVVKQYRPFLEPLNLTYTQYLAMMVFWEERKINVKELGEKLYLDSGTLTPVLKSLEQKGYVRRYRSTEDERVLLVEITEEGDALRAQAKDIPEQITNCINMDSQEIVELYDLLHHILEALSKK